MTSSDDAPARKCGCTPADVARALRRIAGHLERGRVAPAHGAVVALRRLCEDGAWRVATGGAATGGGGQSE